MIIPVEDVAWGLTPCHGVSPLRELTHFWRCICALSSAHLKVKRLDSDLFPHGLK